ncbi:hypothetical protein CTI12_AA585570 [Artemisia annua]|uniref:inositol-1,3,4-trisphosphate 5/6-kinase n=1 Tax=Artemisia annua TaxID=35608 RepID=A0A2U1KK16_ARTAN|nr:hypothetical protein CTI12_AA585570 [Artemisia annua]
MPESEHNNRFQIGYALPLKRVAFFMTPSFVNHAKHQGIDFIPSKSPNHSLIINHHSTSSFTRYTLTKWRSISITTPSETPKLASSAMARKGGGSGEVEMPMDEFVDEVAKGMRQALVLRLFSFDMIIDENGSGYLVIDINYFHGYDSLDSYETFMTDFFAECHEIKSDRWRRGWC